MKKIILLLAGILLTVFSYSHPWKPSHYVIIDTDGGIDDLRAITMFLASPDVRVLGIIVSPGAINADSAYLKVKSLLHSFHHEGLPVGINRNTGFRSPDFPAALHTSWGKLPLKLNIKPHDGAELVKEILKYEKTKISFVCLGGMSTVSSLSEDPVFINGVKQIIWSGDKSEGFNYSIDIRASEKILKGEVPVKLIGGLNSQNFYHSAFLDSVKKITGPYSGKILSVFASEQVKNHKYSFYATDEMVPVWLHYPELFSKKSGNVFIPEETNIHQLRNGMLKILAGETVQKNQVIRYFPEDPSFYFEDVEVSVAGIIEKYGKDEWVSGVIANELHRHLGTYAIIGVKMGIRAREYFNTGVDEFRAVSYAGSVPPLSCMNDGVQVSTGATPGHGLLTVINDKPSPSVEFTYMNRRIRLTLKPEIAEKISSELREINFIYGLDSNIYWELVRKNTIKYWLEMDRHEIFEIEEL